MPFVGFNQELGRKTLGIDVIDNPKKYKWSCPHCNDKLSHVKEHIRMGEFQVIEHFRHEKKCPFSTERDTITHLQMKRWIFDTFKQKYPQIEMEKRIGNHITDVAIREEIEIEDGTKWNDFAIECQASPISPKEIIERTREYTNNGFYTLWILHSKFLEPICLNPGYLANDKSIYKFKYFMETLHTLYLYRIFFIEPEKDLFFVIRFSGRKWKRKKYIRKGRITNLKLLPFINDKILFPWINYAKETSDIKLNLASLYHEKIKFKPTDYSLYRRDNGDYKKTPNLNILFSETISSEDEENEI